MADEIKNTEAIEETAVVEETKKVGFVKRTAQKVGTWVKGHKLLTAGIGVGLLGGAACIAKAIIGEEEPEEGFDEAVEATIENVTEQVTEG